MKNKVEPQKVKGTISLPSLPPIKIGNNAVQNNGSAKTSSEFILSLEKAVKNNIFSGFNEYLNPNAR